MSLRTLLRSAVGARSCGVKLETTSSHPVPDFERLGLLSARDIPQLGLNWAVPASGPLDQLSASSCLANAWCMGEVVNLKARHGIDSPLPSRRAAYYWARQVAGGPIIDDGSRPSDLLRAVSMHGLPPETSFPYSTWRINERPPLSARWDAWDHAGQRRSYQVNYSAMEDRIAACRASLASGRPLIVSVPVGPSFSNYAGSGAVQYPNRIDVKGFHALLVLDCSTTGELFCLNSYGPEYGANGRVLLDSTHLETTFSLICMDVQRPVT